MASDNYCHFSLSAFEVAFEFRRQVSAASGPPSQQKKIEKTGRANLKYFFEDGFGVSVARYLWKLWPERPRLVPSKSSETIPKYELIRVDLVE